MANELFKKAAESSLENAEQWISDASLLIEAGNHEHAFSLLAFADEEIAKAYVCWLVSEDMIPEDSKYVRDAFSDHWSKLQTLLGLELAPFFRAAYELLKKDTERSKRDLKEEDISRFFDWMDEMVAFRQRMRNVGMYVGLDEKKREIQSPKSIEKEPCENLLKGVNRRLRAVREVMTRTTESQKTEMRRIFKKIPKAAWKTGEIEV